MKNTLTINGLSKHFGKLIAVNNLDLTIEQGQVYGVLGPNGSGKTTTLGMILDVVSPTSGNYQWFNSSDNISARKKIGAILETPCFYPYLTAVQNLKISAHIKGCSFTRIDEVLKVVNLDERKHDKFKTFSLGMKQRLSIAAALLANPPVLILDEPTNGLDPQGIAEIRELIREIAADGKTIILASHLLDEVQKVCSHFCVLKKGVKLYEGTVADILGETNEIEVSASEKSQLEKCLLQFEGATSVKEENSNFIVTLKEPFSAVHLNKYCFDRGITLTKLVTRVNSLELEFLKILEEND